MPRMFDLPAALLLYLVLTIVAGMLMAASAALIALGAVLSLLEGRRTSRQTETTPLNASL